VSATSGRRVPGWPAAAWALVVAGQTGCGEIERADLVVRPRKDDYASQIQPIFERLGCSAGTLCHSGPQGDLMLVESPGAAALDENYLATKAKIDLDQPTGSPLIADLLPKSIAPGATHVTVCWKSTESCAYRKINAWIAWDGAEDLRPQDIACEVEVPADTACDDPEVLDVCCFRR
jgi:hypothetical protein